MRRFHPFAAATGLSIALVSAASAHDTIQVGRSAAGQMVGHLHFDDAFLYLPESVFPGFEGFAAPDPGWEAVHEDHPDEDLFMLPHSADIAAVLLASDAEMGVWNGSAFVGVGESLLLGHPAFHIHPIWNAFPSAQVGGTYEMTFMLTDLSGQFTDSDPFTLVFSPIPEPSGAVLLLAAALMRRR